MSYGLKYRIEFADLKGNLCQFDISQKDHSAYDPIYLLGTETPVVVSYEAGDDDVLKPVRGCSASVSYYNTGGETFTVVSSSYLLDVYTADFTGDPAPGDVVTFRFYRFASTLIFTYTVVDGDTIQSVIDALVFIVDAAAAFTAIQSGNGIVVTSVSGSPFLSGTTAEIALSGATAGTPLRAFFSENDDEFLGELYINSELKFKGLLVQDDCSESFNAPPYPVSLSFNDSLGLLKELPLNDTLLSEKIAGKESIASFFYCILQLTGLDMPMEIYNNVFEERMNDRNYDPSTDAFVQSFLKTATFKDENSWKDCFTVLEELLKACDCVLFQADGAWVIMRWPELPRFNNDVPGSTLALDNFTETLQWHPAFPSGYWQFSGNSLAGNFAVGQKFSITDASIEAFNTTYTVTYILTNGGAGSDLIIGVDIEPVTGSTIYVTATFNTLKAGFSTSVAPSLNTIDVSNGGDLVPIEFTQVRSLRRGFRYVSRTFDYNVPPLIKNENLQELGELQDTSIDGDFTLNDYALVGWDLQEGQTSYIRVKSDTDTGREVERYIVMDYNGTQSVNEMPSPAIITPKIEVGRDDRFRFTCSYRASGNSSDPDYFGVFFYLRECGGAGLKRMELIQPTDYSTAYSKWNNNFPYSPYDPGVPPSNVPKYRAGSLDKTEWNAYDSNEQYDPNKFGLARFPYDGTMEIGIYGLNKWRAQNQTTADTYIKDIKLEYFYSINDSTQLDGQIHNATDNPGIKNVLSEDVFIDDAPRQNIAGSLYLDQNELCSELTAKWKTSSDNSPIYRFGQIQSIDRLGMNQKTRLRIEGDFYMNTIPTMKDLIAFGYGGLTGYTFIISRSSFDFKNQKLTATFDEAWNTTDADASDLADFDYTFKYKFKENAN